MGIWTMAELGIGIVSACLPILRPLFRESLTRFRRSSNESNPPETQSREYSTLDLDVGLRQAPSNPAYSKTFASPVFWDMQKDEVDSEKTRTEYLVLQGGLFKW